jgi:hypothetical protein
MWNRETRCLPFMNNTLHSCVVIFFTYIIKTNKFKTKERQSVKQLSMPYMIYSTNTLKLPIEKKLLLIDKANSNDIRY